MELEKEKLEEMEGIHEEGVESGHGESHMLHSEADLSDFSDHEPGHDEEQDHPDFSQYTKAQLVDVVRELSHDTDFRKIERWLRDIRPVMDELCEKERTQAINRYIIDGGSADGFEYKGDELDEAYDTMLRSIRERKNSHAKNQEDQKTENLNKKLAILEKLRELTDSQEVTNQFDQFKELQKEWKSVGPVPGTQARTLWANYHALIDRFYDNQSIYFELKELDRKKNLESKVELCVRAEKLAEVENIRVAIKELNELHNEFKHIGPVPMEDKENVWQRFKAASDAVYARRDEYLKTLQKELGQNLDGKLALCDTVEAFVSFQSDRIKEWNQKTREILDLQKQWEALKGVPRARSKEVNKRFWSAFKQFFSNKNAFFKKLDEGREQNLEQKNQILQRALELKESNDWDSASNELKELQLQWRNIGPVPEKHREKLYQQFKEACDHFFEQRRNQQGMQESQQADNLKAKEAICGELEKHVAEKTATPERLKELEAQFSTIGFVPKNAINSIRSRYQKAVDNFIKAIEGLSDNDKSRLALELQLIDLKNDPMADNKIYHKEQAIRKKISKVENDLAVWRNNLEFFARAKNGEKVREEFNAKIEEAAGHLHELKQQLKLLRTVS
jgi:hypothetical protein